MIWLQLMLLMAGAVVAANAVAMVWLGAVATCALCSCCAIIPNLCPGWCFFSVLVSLCCATFSQYVDE